MTVSRYRFDDIYYACSLVAAFKKLFVGNYAEYANYRIVIVQMHE